MPQICDGMVGICAIADTISPYLKANLELVDQQSWYVQPVSQSIFTSHNSKCRVAGEGFVFISSYILYFLSPHSRVHCFTVCDFLTVREKCQKENWTNVIF